ncbi:MAG: HAMP domain-containing histidine kinase, partial [Marinilabiliales bacterium]|nr:HAMP domain-containing histidine kinase [Marinilabiliales bacterium]
MSKKMINILAIVMAISVAVMVWVQLLTINKTVELQEKDFSYVVNLALHEVTDGLVNEEAKLFYILEQSDYVSESSSSAGISLYPYASPTESLNKLKRSGELTATRNKKSVRAMNGYIELQQSMTTLTIPSMQSSYNRRSEMQSQALRYQIFIMERSEMNIADRIASSEALKIRLEEEMKSKDVNLAFKYCVKTAVNGKMEIAFGDKDYHPSKGTREYKTLLFAEEQSPKPNFLYIYFPDHYAEQIKATSDFVLPSILLTIIIIGIFVFTLQIILRQKKLSQIKNDFINNMTHELKTPISTISLASQMLKDNSLVHSPTTIDHISGVILDESKRLSNQVEKVLQMAVFNEGKLKLKFSEIELNQIVAQAAANFEIRVTNANGTLESHLTESDTTILGDEVHITNVIYNLLDNAEKYSKESPRIEIMTENRGNWIVVQIKDNG